MRNFPNANRTFQAYSIFLNHKNFQIQKVRREFCGSAPLASNQYSQANDSYYSGPTAFHAYPPPLPRSGI